MVRYSAFYIDDLTQSYPVSHKVGTAHIPVSQMMKLRIAEVA